MPPLYDFIDALNIAEPLVIGQLYGIIYNADPTIAQRAICRGRGWGMRVMCGRRFRLIGTRSWCRLLMGLRLSL